MKEIIKWITIVAITITVMSCDKGDSVGPTQINTETPQLSELDIWIRNNFTTPYNIEIQYKWNENEVDLNRYLYPPTVDNIKPLLEVVKAIWIEPYTQLGGENFIKNIAPRQFTLAGGFNYNQSATITLGFAEAGTKITLFNVDQLDLTDLVLTKRYFKTIQHEYTHILNQTKPFDPAFGEVNPKNYTAQWFNRSLSVANELGYITPYASSSAIEDYAEMVSVMLTNSKTEFDALVDGITSNEARASIRTKEQFVVKYFTDEFGIDLYELQELVNQKTLDIVN
ncbi:substrate import-associated zinc metallohydrolase lipoprotein [Aquimarina sp. MAR_2010_214]|uniref:zinc-binding metallopeptidase n=1 Tax=Aquimarina sp. MAR_2010_214 TaxID=1250026 RepID=UPI000C707D62|nr:putative zinc-binding metallopeptidase [Aquimarina sp. MAR_2010_214]PKV50465.1 substrate import-associated zinc metallohydrolase lipoprotein [Aquimarina sp. MAR_2010_214]